MSGDDVIPGGNPERDHLPQPNGEGHLGASEETLALGGLRRVITSELAQQPLEWVARAASVEVFSTNDGKKVELAEDEQGRFVRRTYYTEGQNKISPTFDDEDFAAKWEKFNEMATAAGLKVVPSFLRYDHNPVIVTEYFGKVDGEGNSNTVKGQSTVVKVDLCGGLGRMLSSSEEYLPDFRTVEAGDAFIAHPESGELHWIDCDPYLVSRNTDDKISKRKYEVMVKMYIDKIADNIDEWANDDDERQAMATAFVRASQEFILTDPKLRENQNDPNSLINHEVLDSFSRIHAVHLGIRPQVTDNGPDL